MPRIQMRPLDMSMRSIDVDAKRRERQGHERCDAIARAHRRRTRQRRADRAHATDEHAAGTRDGVVMFAALGDERQNVRRDARFVAAARFDDLPERRAIDVQRLDVAENFVVVARRRSVEFPGCLRQHARGFENAMAPEAARLHERAHGALATARRRPFGAGSAANSSKAMPLRSKGDDSTIIVFVRAMPGTALRRERKSSR